MDGPPILIVLGDFIAEFENVRGRRPYRVYVTWDEHSQVLATNRVQLLAWATNPRYSPEQCYLFDGAKIFRSRAAHAIRAWDLTPF